MSWQNLHEDILEEFSDEQTRHETQSLRKQLGRFIGQGLYQDRECLRRAWRYKQHERGLCSYCPRKAATDPGRWPQCAVHLAVRRAYALEYWRKSYKRKHRIFVRGRSPAEATKAWRESQKKKGLCTLCVEPLAPGSASVCIPHRDAARIRARQSWERKKAAA